MPESVVKIGYAATRRGCFNHPEGHEFREKIKEMVSGWGGRTG